MKNNYVISRIKSLKMTSIHVLFLLAFAFVIKNQIVGSIDSFFGLVSSKIAIFQGKTVPANPAPAV